MQKPTMSSIKTFLKYLFWTAIAAAIQAGLNHLSGLALPEWSIPIIGAALKGAATWVQVYVDENDPYPGG